MNMHILVSTLSGNSNQGFQDGKIEDAIFDNPSGICMSDDGKIYLIDYYNNCVRMISDDVVSTIAGGNKGRMDGKAKYAQFQCPRGICTSHNGTLYISDSKNCIIRMISNDLVSTVAGCGQKGYLDGKAENAMFHWPMGLCTSSKGDLYIADVSGIRMLSDGVVSTKAGGAESGFQDGKAEDAKFAWPSGICISQDDKKIYLVDTRNHRIRMISDGMVSTIAGCGAYGFQDGKALEATFFHPGGMCISKDGRIFIADQRNHCIRMISDGIVSTIAGNGKEGFQDGKGEDAMFNWPDTICISEDDEIYVTDSCNNRIRLISGLPIPPPPFEYFELSSLLYESKSLSDMTLTINNHQYHLHKAVVYSLCPMIIKHKSIIEDARISHESLQTTFEMIYSNQIKKIRKPRNQYHMTDLRRLAELIWLLESFEIKNESFVTTCVKQFKTETKYLIKKEEYKSTIEIFKNELIERTDELIALSQLHGLETTKLVEINHFINQINEQKENQHEKPIKTKSNNQVISISMHDLFLFFGSHTEPRVVDQQQIKSETLGAHLETNPIPDYTIMTHDRSYSIKCHKLILYGKWSYFRRMIESGLLESASGEMIMSEDWNATRLYDFVKYLYTHEVGFESVEDCRWLLENAALYGLMETSTNKENQESDIPKKDYQLLIESCRIRLSETT